MQVYIKTVKLPLLPNNLSCVTLIEELFSC